MSLFGKGKNVDSAGDQSMHFWGVCCESGKQYAQVVGQRFRITMAVLDPKSHSKEDNERTVSLIVIRGGIEYLLCVLKHGEIHQVNLNLIFDKGENVVFYLNGQGKVYLSGYQLTDSQKDVLNDENGYLCPLVEVKSPKSKLERKVKGSKTPSISASKSLPLSSKKRLELLENDLIIYGKRKSNIDGLSDGSNNNIIDRKSEVDLDDGKEQSDSDDSEDEDYDEESEDEESESEESSEDEEELEDEKIEDLIIDEYEEDEEKEISLSKASQKKRKLAKESPPQKRSRYESFTSSTKDVEKSGDDTTKKSQPQKRLRYDSSTNPTKEVEKSGDDTGSKDSSDPDVFTSSINNTPMPKNQSTEKKKSKRKKKVKGQMKTLVAENTPNKDAIPVRVLEGGVEIQDLSIGRGPEATRGKMVHVFYVGRLPNKRIFDSRLPGKKPFSFKVGANQVIRGWDIGIIGMKAGGRRKLLIPPKMGYGSAAIEGIPRDTPLSFLVDLQNVS